MNDPRSAIINATQQHLRLIILRLLEGSRGYASNDSVLVDVIPSLGLTPTRDQVAGTLTWLDEQGLVSVEIVAGDLRVVKLTQRGVDVARGMGEHPGVKRPSP